MRKIFWLLLIIFIAGCGLNKDNQNKRGTFIIVATGKDGIIIASDSRSSSIKGHEDSVSKIYAVNGYLIAMSGLVTFGDKYLDEIVKEYNSLNIKSVDCLSNFQNFINFMLEKYPDTIYDSKHNKYFAGGYKNDTAYIMIYEDYNGGAYTIPFITQWSKTDSLFKKVYNKNQTCTKIAIVAEKFINSIADTIKSKDIGGPISIYKINRDNSFVSIKNDFMNNPQRNNLLR